ncbi:MAG: PA domain-containing protein [Luteolibacter sp.]
MFCALALASPALEGAEFVFVNKDGPGEGLNDTTVVAPVGGNTATTLGGQRLAALQRAGEIWGRYLVSSVPIRVEVEFDALGASTLASAGPITVESNFTNAPQAGMLYTVAQANSLAGRDLRPTRNDITVTVNSNADFHLGFNQDFEATGTNFIDTILHELGHGLGFICLVDTDDGTYNLNTPDVFSSLVFDISMNARWTSLTAAERLTSSTSGTNLAWDGAFSNAGANQVLGPDTLLRTHILDAVLPDLTQLGDREFLTASFAPRIPGRGISGLLVVTDDGSGAATSTLACQDIVNGAEVAGNIAFIRRGSCNFDDKVFRAQEAGAVAVVIANNVEGALLTPSGDDTVEGVLVDITVPAVLINKADGDAMEAASPGVRIDFAQRQGARTGSNSGRVNLFAPNPVQGGSSLSHWTTATSPNLLMEPIINTNLDRRLDLTLPQMKDIGWEVVDIPFPHESYAIWAARIFDAGATLTAENDDADGDGATNLEEYFFGSLPDDASSRRFPEFVVEAGEPHLEIVVSSLPADLLYGIEISEALDGFDPAVTHVDVTMGSREVIDDETERLAFSFVTTPEKRFARVRIEKKVP